MPQSNPSGAGTDVLAALRGATAERHARLDRALPLADPDAGAAHYAEHLRLLRPWLKAWEDWLLAAPHAASGPYAPEALAPVRRTPLFDADLALLPSPPATDAASTASAWQATLPPSPAPAAWRWGVAYVIEGSQLGAQVLARQLGERLAPHPLAALRQGTPRWPAFIAALRGAVQAPADIAQAVQGACLAFDTLLQRVPAAAASPGAAAR